MKSDFPPARTIFLAVIAAFSVQPAAPQDSLLPARLLPLPVTEVRIEDKFWAPRIETNRTRTLETVRRRLLEMGAIQNFAIASGRSQGAHRGPFWADSDVYKWLEGASYSLAVRRDPELESKVDDVIAGISAAQMSDGYLNTYFQLEYPEGRWTFLAFGHEMYSAGHLFEAAAAHFEATGKRTLLDIAIRNADHIDATFGPGKRQGQPGHEEIEVGLMKLARTTGDEKYVRLAQYFIDQRGQKPSFFETEYAKLDPDRRFAFLGNMIGLRTFDDRFFRRDPSKFDTQYSQDHLPVRQQDKVVGHAVRAMYLYSGMADVVAETGDRPMFDALVRLYRDLTTKRMYITGGIGPSAHNEGFTTDYDLPNETAYQETCASIGVVMWTHRMLSVTGDSRYADTMELALYNGLPAGVSLAGDTFFYANPLYSRGNVARQDWFTVPCCPTNVVRIMPSIGKYVYGQTGDALWIHLYVQGSAKARFANGDTLTLTQETDYPWSGAVRIRVSQPPKGEYGLNLRIPGWTGGATFKLNGAPLKPPIEKGYAKLLRHWSDGDSIEMDLPLSVQAIQAHPSVLENRGRVALRRGPVIYCFEQADQQADIDRLVLPASAKLEGRFQPRLLNGVSVIEGSAFLKPAVSWDDQLYQPANNKLEGPVPVRAAPYCTWGNRGAGKMAVWIESSR